MDPKKVNPSNFKVDKIIYNDDEFSIAFGTSANNSKIIGMRWNGDDDENIGFPNSYNKPMWFVIPSDLAKNFITTLTDNKFTDKELLQKTISELDK